MQAALTEWEVVETVQSLEYGGAVTLISLKPHTGRTHQVFNSTFDQIYFVCFVCSTDQTLFLSEAYVDQLT